MSKFKNDQPYPVSYKLGDEVVMVPPGGEVTDNTVNSDYPVPAPFASNATNTAEAFAAAAFRSATGVTALPVVENPLAEEEETVVGEIEAEPQVVKGAEVVEPQAEAQPEVKPVTRKEKRK